MEVDEIMVGRTLEYEAKTILNQGIEQGIELGIEQGIELGIEQGINLGESKTLLAQIIKKVQKGKSLQTISEDLESTEEEIRPFYNMVLAATPDYNIDKMLELIFPNNQLSFQL